jgi:hypothetical protein
MPSLYKPKKAAMYFFFPFLRIFTHTNNLSALSLSGMLSETEILDFQGAEEKRSIRKAQGSKPRAIPIIGICTR